jgi:tetratricopeptide (TPR) repeat protein
MPTTTYMVVDPRHDHGFRVPRPDRTVSLGIPNACNQCHKDRPASWAAAAVKQWYPQPKPGFQTYAEAFAAADRGDPSAARALAAVVEDRTLSGYVRASAVARLGRSVGPQAPPLRSALADADPLVRSAAVGALSAADPALLVQLLPPLLGDPVREVRMATARALAGDAEARLSPAQRTKFDAALGEYIAAERFNADRPEGRSNLGTLYATQGRFDDAVEALRAALALDPSFTPAALNLADVHRSRGREDDAEQVLRAALARDPRAADARFALGLSLVRQKRTDDALKELAQAARLAPDITRFAYVYAVALNDAGRGAQARRELETALKRHPHDRDLLLALALFERDAGRRERAISYARRLAELAPENAQVAQLLRELGAGDR